MSSRAIGLVIVGPGTSFPALKLVVTLLIVT
jgi:hypothetical protein